jgi:competence protein ComEA
VTIAQEQIAAGGGTGSSGTGGTSSSGSGAVSNGQQGVAGTASSGSSTAASTASGKVNINTADISGLTSISGIGKTRAEAIISYREEHGAFLSVEDIKNVSGIGDATFEKIKDQITVN